MEEQGHAAPPAPAARKRALVQNEAPGSGKRQRGLVRLVAQSPSNDTTAAATSTEPGGASGLAKRSKRSREAGEQQEQQGQPVQADALPAAAVGGPPRKRPRAASKAAAQQAPQPSVSAADELECEPAQVSGRPAAPAAMTASMQHTSGMAAAGAAPEHSVDDSDAVSGGSSVASGSVERGGSLLALRGLVPLPAGHVRVAGRKALRVLRLGRRPRGRDVR